MAADRTRLQDTGRTGSELEQAQDSREEPTLPPDLLHALRDPTIVLPRDREVRLADGRTLWEHLESWRNAPSNTMSADWQGKDTVKAAAWVQMTSTEPGAASRVSSQPPRNDGSALVQKANEMRGEFEPEYSHWRVCGVEDGEVRVARDRYQSPAPGPQLQPEHLEIVASGYVAWRPHRQGDVVPSVPLSAFIAWLDQQ